MVQFLVLIVACFASQVVRAILMAPSNIIKRISKLIPSNSFLTPTSINVDQVENIETSWLNVQLNSKEQSWSFQDLIGFETNNLLCLHRWKVWWMIPRLIHDSRQEGSIPPETNFLLGRIEDMRYLLILPIIDQNMVFSLEGSTSYGYNTSMDGSGDDILPYLMIHGLDNSLGPLRPDDIVKGIHEIEDQYEGLYDTSSSLLIDETELLNNVNEGEGDTTNSNASLNDSSSKEPYIATRKACLLAIGLNPFDLIQHAMNMVKQHIRSQSPSNSSNSSSSNSSGSTGSGSSTKGNGGSHISNNDNSDNKSVSKEDNIEESLSLHEGEESKNVINNKTRNEWFPRGPGPSFIDHFGWCTWDSYYTDLSSDRVLSGLQSFQSTGIHPRFVILDDGWQGTDVDDQMNGQQWGGHLRSFHANFKFHPEYKVSIDTSSSVTVDSTKLVSGETVTSTTLTVTKKEVIEVPQHIHKEGLHSLDYVIQSSKADYGIKQFLVWHSLTGYWAGVVPQAHNHELHTYNSRITFPYLPASMNRMSHADALPNEPFSTHGVGLVDRKHVQLFYSTYHKTLQEMGVDGVKVDAQSIVPSLVDYRGGGWDLTYSFHAGLQHAIRSHFNPTKYNTEDTSSSNAPQDISGIDIEESIVTTTPTVSSQQSTEKEHPIIHCMCHSQGTMWSIATLYPNIHDPIASTCTPSSTESEEHTGQGTCANLSAEDEEENRMKKLRLQPIIRGSDDFWPLDPASHGPHIFSNTLNSLLLNHVGLQDWDAFQSKLNVPLAASMHAVSRAISGGPVYTSDKPDQHDREILRKLAFTDGSIPRCIRNAMPIERLLFSDPQRTAGIPLIIQNINPAGGLVLGVFHILGAVLEEDLNLFRFLSPDEIAWPPPTQQVTNTDSDSEGESDKNNGDNNIEEKDEISEYDVDDTCAHANSYHTTYNRHINHQRHIHAPQVPIYENKDYTHLLKIKHFVSPDDVYEVTKYKSTSTTTDFADEYSTRTSLPFSSKDTLLYLNRDYIGRRSSDGSLYYIRRQANGQYNKVPFELRTVFETDIISFSPINYISTPISTISTTMPKNDKRHWISSLGAIRMYNSGGAVLDTQVHTPTSAESEEDKQTKGDVTFTIKLLGNSDEYIILTTYSRVSILTYIPLYMDGPSVKVSIHSTVPITLQGYSDTTHSPIYQVRLKIDYIKDPNLGYFTKKDIGATVTLKLQ